MHLKIFLPLVAQPEEVRAGHRAPLHAPLSLCLLCCCSSNDGWRRGRGENPWPGKPAVIFFLIGHLCKFRIYSAKEAPCSSVSLKLGTCSTGHPPPHYWHPAILLWCTHLCVQVFATSDKIRTIIFISPWPPLRYACICKLQLLLYF